jgi:hypothetical protein
MIRACGADDVARAAALRKLRFQMIDREHPGSSKDCGPSQPIGRLTAPHADDFS